MSRARLYWETLRHLRPSQIAWQLVRRAAPLPAHRPVRAEPVRPGLRVQPFAPTAAPAVGPGEVAFLNRARALDPQAVDWASAEQPKLWRYNLHYFDYLHWPAWGPALKDALVGSWIAAHPVPAGDGWEPYPLSLRTVNWIKYALAGGRPLPPAVLDSLATQVGALATRLEYHLLANHLLKNGKALFFGGCYFAGPRADRWRALGLRILLAEADEQVLPDGGHYERSPMYHGIVLEDYLDAVNLVRGCPDLVAPADAAKLAATAARARDFLAGIVGGDGRIPLFNDSAFGIAPEVGDLLAYADRVLGAGCAGAPVGAPSGATGSTAMSVLATAGDPVAPEGAPTGAPTGATPITRICFPQTGYFGYRDGGDSLVVDCGPVGPDYQPGHAHCDTLSYELCVGGARAVVDAGVGSYEPDAWRHQVRATASHNTVTVDGAEQSEIWGAFRVARRARPLGATLADLPGGGLEFSGAHDGYTRLPDGPVHQRRLRMRAGGPWEVFDLIRGGGGAVHRVVSRIHLDPDVEAWPEGDRAWGLRIPSNGAVLRLSVTGGSLTRLESGYHFSEFGLRRDNKIIVIEREGKLPLEMSYRIERH
jgi:uncharacterized heparinase superfamily protein